MMPSHITVEIKMSEVEAKLLLLVLADHVRQNGPHVRSGQMKRQGVLKYNVSAHLFGQINDKLKDTGSSIPGLVLPKSMN